VELSRLRKIFRVSLILLYVALIIDDIRCGLIDDIRCGPSRLMFNFETVDGFVRRNIYTVSRLPPFHPHAFRSLSPQLSHLLPSSNFVSISFFDVQKLMVPIKKLKELHMGALLSEMIGDQINVKKNDFEK
jgi:hypothetical protein